MALRFSRRHTLWLLGALPLPILAACGGGAASPTTAPKTEAKPTEAPKPAEAAKPTEAAKPAATTAPATKPTEAAKPGEAAKPTEATKPTAAAGGVLTVAQLGALTKTLHPYPSADAYTSTWTDAVTMIWNGGLLNFDANDLEYKPDMAKSLQVSPDGKTFTFTLRDDLKWSDGSPVTTDDFLFAYEMAKDEKNAFVGLDDVKRIASFTAPDAKTIIVTLDKVYARDIATGVANSIGPVPSKIWKGKSWSDPQANPEILNPTVILGPYKVKEFRQAEGATFEKITTHFGGQPNLDQIVFKPGQQPTVAYELLKSGQAQWAPNIPPSQYAEAKSNPDLTMLEWTAANSAYRVLEFNLKNPVLAKKEVREAIARAISREDLIQVAETGLGAPQFSFITPANTKWNNPNVEKYDFNVNRAKELLQAGGLKLDGATLKDAQGQPVKFIVYYPQTSAPRGKIATYLQQQLKQLGIEVEVRGMEFAAYVDQISKKKEFDLSLGTYGGGSIDPDLGAKSQLISTGTQNVTGYKSEQIDKLFNDAAVEQDTAKRKAMYDEVQKMVSADLPAFYLYTLTSFSPISKKLGNVKPNKLDRLYYNRAFNTWTIAK